MPTITLTAVTFADRVQRDAIVFIDFWASWCAPCHAFAPVFEAASGRHPDITWAKVDTDTEGLIDDSLRVRPIPMVTVYRDGMLVFTQAGTVNGAALDELARRVRALDMDAIRKGAPVDLGRIG